MDISNLAHFFFSMVIPIAWISILKPFTSNLFKNFSQSLSVALLLSILVICGKEWIDADFSLNDIVSDFLGFFLGLSIISNSFHRRNIVLQKEEQREIFGHQISLRSTMGLMEMIERKSATFYSAAALQIKDKRASKICYLLARDAKSRANKITYILSGWRSHPLPNELPKSIENSFSSDQIFALNINRNHTPKEIIEIAIQHEKKKLSLFVKLEQLFQDHWKLMSLAPIVGNLDHEVHSLEACLAELEKQNKNS